MCKLNVSVSRHAGYSYSGECAAWSYKCLDLSKAKRVFILGPSHTYYLEGCAVTTYSHWATPFGNLTVDTDVSRDIQTAGDMDDIPTRNDKDEHSMEMQAPYLYKRLEQTFQSPEQFPKIVPILIGDNSRAEEKDIGLILLPYLKDPENAFIVSSDFCHWGWRFSYTVYSPEKDPSKLKKLSQYDSVPAGPPIHETIQFVDELAMNAVKSGSHDAFVDNLKQTKNTVCGRHPIGVMMAALELLGQEAPQEGKHRFKFVNYQRSSMVESPGDSSVSYCAAYTVL